MMRKKRERGKKAATQIALLITTLFFLAACGSRNLPSQDEGFFTSQVIIGDLDWKEITGLSSMNPVRISGRAVGDVDLPVMGSRCTGFLISEDVLMTNHHCIPSSSHARGVTVKFKHEKGVPASAHEKFDCSTFIGNNRELDFALLKCSGKPGRKFGFVELGSDSVSTGAPIYIVQQNCDYYTKSDCDWSKKYSEGKITKIAEEYSHNADTLGGSSGSPVFSKATHEVVAIHHAGAGNNGMGRGYENFAVPMSRIVPFILTNFPQVDLGGSSDDDDDDGGGAVEDYEPNNSLGSSSSVSLPFQENLMVSSSSDNDYFKFKVGAPGKLRIKVTFSHAQGDLDLKLINGSKKVIGKSESTSNGELISKDIEVGTYFVKVYGYSGATGAYKIDISFEGQSVNDGPNDSVETATAVSLPLDLEKEIETVGDQDFYKFEVESSGYVQMELLFSHAKGDLDLYLLDGSGNVIDKSTGTKNSEGFNRYLSKGTFYVAVKGYKSARGSYTLKSF